MLDMEIEAAESVTIGHPDRVCDQIADAILRQYEQKDPGARVAIECMGGHGHLWICGEVTSKAKVDIKKCALQTYREIGYTDSLEVSVHISHQSPDIALGVDTGGAGDQGIVYGYATKESAERLPMAYVLAVKLTDRLTHLRRSDANFSWLGPDGKSLVVTKNKKPIKVVLSTQHAEEIDTDTLRKQLYEQVILPIVPGIDRQDCYINNTGRFVQGGFTADTGLTGRKLMVDAYGGLVPHGGGSTHGKDMTKVDRSEAEACREEAVALLERSGVSKALIAKVFAIGEKDPIARCEITT
jgi:S-adenosylmethionine synthetase